jgi:hypothetical protein
MIFSHFKKKLAIGDKLNENPDRQIPRPCQIPCVLPYPLPELSVGMGTIIAWAVKFAGQV